MYPSEDQKNAVLSFRKLFKTVPMIPISQMQARSFRESPLKGPLLVSKVKIPRPDETEGTAISSKLWDIWKAKSEGVEKLDPPAPWAAYDGEWVGGRADVEDPKAVPPDASDYEKFQGIERYRRNDVTLFYIPGGAWFRYSLPTARQRIKQLCDNSNSRAFAFQYRLAPQHTLPTILLDTLLAYFYLLSPPPGSFHRPIDPKNIILTGESGGANLHLALLQVLQSLSRSSKTGTITFNGRDISLEMPKGCAIISPG